MTSYELFEQEYKKDNEIIKLDSFKLCSIIKCSPSHAREIKRQFAKANNIELIKDGKEAGVLFEESEYIEKRKEDGSVEISDIVERRLTDEELFKRYNRSPKNWRISNVYFKDKSGGRVLLTVQFVSLFKSHTLLAVEELKADIKTYAPKYEKIKYEKKELDSVMLEVSIYDLHYAKLCWQPETGNNYDSKIAERRFFEALKDLVKRASSVYHIEKILFVIGNDFFNADGKSNATTGGTPQDNDSRWKKVFTGGRKLIVTGIEMLMQAAPVEVISVEGNHAEQAEFYLADAIECWFHSCPNVNINNTPKARKYFSYGNSLIGFTHGHLEKTKDLPLLMASEVPDQWSKAKYREFHCGHLHHERELVFNTSVENKTVVVRHLSSLSGTDSWHTGAGYIGQKQSAMGFIWSKDSGIRDICYHTIQK